LGNITYILLLGPILEEKYGSLTILVMMGVTAFFTRRAECIIVFYGTPGASGLCLC